MPSAPLGTASADPAELFWVNLANRQIVDLGHKLTG
jgi:hypothetical protein